MTATRQVHRAPTSDWSWIEDSGRGVSKKKVEMIDYLCVYVKRSFIAVLAMTLVSG